jgi:hypothetical protein
MKIIHARDTSDLKLHTTNHSLFSSAFQLTVSITHLLLPRHQIIHLIHDLSDNFLKLAQLNFKRLQLLGFGDSRVVNGIRPKVQVEVYGAFVVCVRFDTWFGGG